MKRILYILSLVLFLHSCKNAFKDALVLDINSISFEKADTIVFGSNQDIIVNGLPDSTLSVTFSESDSAFTWQLNKPAYFRLNDTTQNAISLDSIDSIEAEGHQYYTKDIKPITDQFFRNQRKGFLFFKKKKGNSYIKLSNIIRNLGTEVSPETDGLNSLIAYDEENEITKLIILDTNVSVVKTNGIRQPLKTNGSVKSRELSVEFFRTFNSVLLDTTKKSKLFHIRDTAFFTTVKSYYTPFGANKFSITANEKLAVLFNKHFREVIPKFAIDSALTRNDSNSVNIKQKAHSNTYSNDLYTTNISNCNAVALGNVDASLQFAQSKNNPLLNENNLSSFRIDKRTFIYSILPLIFVFIFGLIVIYFVTEKNDIYEIESNQGESSKWRNHFWILFTALFFLSVGRIFIGYNLSYTAPYFSFAFPTSIIVSPLLLLTVLYVWLIFILHNDPDAIGFKCRVALFVVPIVLLFILRYVVIDNFPFYIQDFPEINLRLLNPRNWKSIEVHYLTIISLVISLVFFLITVSIQLVPISRNNDISFKYLLYLIYLALLAIGFLFFAKNSYSVSALLLAVWTLIGLGNKGALNLTGNSKIAANIINFFKQRFKLTLDVNYVERLLKFTLIAILPLIVALLLAFLYSDGGYFINVIIFPTIISVILFGLYKYYSDADSGINWNKTKFGFFINIGFIFIVFVGSFFWAKNKSQGYNPLEPGRMGSRFTSFFDFNTVHEYGIRESEKQAQFFAELSKYSYPSQHNLYEPIHPGISSFIDPVVKNDLSVPFGLIYQFGETWLIPILGLILIWSIIFFSVLRTTITPTANSNNQRYFTQYAIIRIYCACMLVGSGLWLIASYYNIVPFTGRLIFGLGQDSIAEVFETIFLFSYMGLISKTEG